MTAATGDRVQSDRTIAIVGAGFAGTMVGVHLLMRASSPLRITLIERHPEQFCRGVAYSTRENCHLLNVGAGDMSAFPDYPDGFLRWALDRKQRLAGSFPGDEISPHAFLPGIFTANICTGCSNGAGRCASGCRIWLSCTTK